MEFEVSARNVELPKTGGSQDTQTALSASPVCRDLGKTFSPPVCDNVIQWSLEPICREVFVFVIGSCEPIAIVGYPEAGFSHAGQFICIAISSGLRAAAVAPQFGAHNSDKT